METTAYGIGVTAPRALEEFSVEVVSLDTVIQRCNGEGAIALVKATLKEPRVTYLRARVWRPLERSGNS
jgi:hypothetical protein